MTELTRSGPARLDILVETDRRVGWGAGGLGAGVLEIQ
jgi:hypothetical protein